MKHGLRLVALAGLAALLAIAALACSEDETATPSASGTPSGDDWGTVTIDAGAPIRIGLSTSLSGGTAQLGADIRDGALLAQDAQGRAEIKGHKVEIVSEDDGCNGQGSQAVANKFVADPTIVAIIGPMCSGGAVPASDIYNTAHISMVSSSATNPGVTNRDLPAVFRTAWNDQIQGSGQARYAYNTLGSRKAVVIHDKSIYGQGLTDIFAEEFKKLGGEVLTTEAITVGDTDFSAVVSKIQPLEADLIVFGGFTPEGTLLIQQLRAAGIETQFMGADGIDVQSDFVDAAQGAAEGAIITNGSPVSGPEYDKFKTDFEAKFGRPIGVFSAQSSDAYNIIFDAINKVAVEQDGKLVIDRKALNEALAATDFAGLTGPIKFLASPHGDRVLGADVAIKQVKDGAIVQVELIKAE